VGGGGKEGGRVGEEVRGRKCETERMEEEREGGRGVGRERGRGACHTWMDNEVGSKIQGVHGRGGTLA